MLNISDLLNNHSELPRSNTLPTKQQPPVLIPQEASIDLEQFDAMKEPRNTLPYTISDDLSIFRVIAAYYGNSFRGKIPWSFWQTYKRVSGCTRSTSSLYHHWSGAIMKKYEPFLRNGKLTECINWLEMAVSTGKDPTAEPDMGHPQLVKQTSQIIGKIGMNMGDGVPQINKNTSWNHIDGLHQMEKSGKSD